MVNESIAIATLDKQRTASARQQQDQGQPQSADNFSWKFFEEVSSVDNQLRCEDESRIITVTSNNDGDVDKRVIINGHRDEDKSSLAASAAATHDANDDEANNSALMTTGRAITHDLSALNINDRRLHFTHHHQQQQQSQPPHQQHEDNAHPHNNNKTITGNCNGGLNEAEILSQHSSDIVLPLQPAASTTTTTPFQFTSPTSTFKRKKLQQQQQQQLNATLNRNQLQLEATFEPHPAQQPHKQHQHKRQASTSITPRVQQSQPPPLPPPQPQHGTLLYNETTVMISGAGSIINPDTGIGSSHTTAATTTSSTATKTHTLPAAATAATYAPSATKPGRYALDLVTSTATKKHQATRANRLQSQPPAKKEAAIGHKKSTMGSKLTTGHNGTHTRSSTSSNNNCDDSFGNAAKAKRQKSAHERRMSASAMHKPAAGHNFIDGFETHLGLIGWRKRCLYVVLLLLMLLIVTNLVLTLWILKVMEFSPEGMGQLKIVPGGIQLTGQALIMDMLRASTIRSRHGQSLAIESSRNFSINTRDANGKLENHLFLGHDKLECMATGFRINDTAGRNLFSVNRNEVTIGAHALRIEGEGGAIFRESIQTPHIRAEPGRELRFESPTRQLELTAARDINLQSRAGGIEISALEDVKLSALDGSIRLESSKILMPNLRTAQQPMPGTAQSRDHLHRVFQLCACANGKLFLAAPHSICAGDDSTVCR